MKTIILTIALSIAAVSTLAETEVGITKDMSSVTVDTLNGPVEISRIQDTDHKIDGEWARTSRPCPNFCIQPTTPALGVTTVGELELIEMLQDRERDTVEDLRKRLDRAERLIEDQRPAQPAPRKWFWQR
jgi:hypothetical protein